LSGIVGAEPCFDDLAKPGVILLRVINALKDVDGVDVALLLERSSFAPLELRRTTFV
jgi:hypothetical protein